MVSNNLIQAANVFYIENLQGVDIYQSDNSIR